MHMFSTLFHNILGKLTTKLKQANIILRKMFYIPFIDPKQPHIAHIIQQIIKTNMLMSQHRSILFTSYPSRLDIPDRYVTLICILDCFHVALLVYALD